MLDEKDGYKEVQLGPRKLKIPHNWGKTKIGKLAKYLNGYGFSSSDWSNKGLPIIRIQNLTNSTGKEINYYNGELEDRYIVENGDLLVSWSATLGVFKWQGQKAALNQHIFKVNPKEIVDEDFLYFLLDHNLGVLKRKIHGTTMKHITKSTFENTFVSLPPFPEQKKIADVLSTVDDAIQKTEEIIERTKELKKGLMQDLLTKGIGHEEFKEVQLGPESVENPIEWDIRTLGDVCDINMGSSPPSKYYNEEQNGLPFYQGNSEFSDIYPQPEVWCSKPQKTAKSGSVLISVRAPVGEINLSPHKCCIGRGIAALDGQNIYNRFMFYLLKGRHKRLQSYAQGSTFKAINKSVLENLPILLPPLPEQKKIAEVLSTVDQKIQREQNYKEKLEELKKGLMQDLLTGKVRVLSLLSDEDKEELEESDVTG